MGTRLERFSTRHTMVNVNAIGEKPWGLKIDEIDLIS